MSAPTSEEVHDAIEAWHGGESDDRPLHEFLGWSWEEYVVFVGDDDAIPNRPLGDRS